MCFRIGTSSWAGALLCAWFALALPQVASAQEPLRVLTTVGMIADVARNVAGDCAEVQALMGSGSDPHLYRKRIGREPPSAGGIDFLCSPSIGSAPG